MDTLCQNPQNVLSQTWGFWQRSDTFNIAWAGGSVKNSLPSSATNLMQLVEILTLIIWRINKKESSEDLDYEAVHHDNLSQYREKRIKNKIRQWRVKNVLISAVKNKIILKSLYIWSIHNNWIFISYVIEILCSATLV